MDETLDFIRRELRYRLGVTDEQVMLENARVLSDGSNTRGAVITLVNVGVSTYQGSVLNRPGWLDLLELTVLISFRFPDYRTSLAALSRTMRLFHTKPSYTATDSHPDNPFPASLESILFTVCPLEFGAWTDLWGMLGGAQVPSVAYNLRMVQKKS
jgi:hypothetical protein